MERDRDVESRIRLLELQNGDQENRILELQKQRTSSDSLIEKMQRELDNLNKHVGPLEARDHIQDSFAYLSFAGDRMRDGTDAAGEDETTGTTILMRVAGAEFVRERRPWLAWALVYGVFMVTMRCIMLYIELFLHVLQKDESIGKRLLFAAWALVEVSTFSHWICAIHLRRGNPKVHVKIFKSGKYLLFALALQTATLLCQVFSKGDPHKKSGALAKDWEYVRFVFENVQITLSHWSTSVLLQQDFLALRKKLRSALCAAHIAEPVSLEDFDRLRCSIQGRWAFYLLFHMICELLALMLFMAGSYISATNAQVSAVVDNVSSFVFILTLLLVQLRSVISYNRVVENLGFKSPRFNVLHAYWQRRLGFTIFRITFGPTKFYGLLYSSSALVVGSAFRHICHHFGIS